MKKIQLTIIVIGYNVEKYIANCLNSILGQINKDVELLFVDDGSNDKTSKIVNSLFENKENCIYIYKENGGANSARIYGYKKANGEYITFVDGDDTIAVEYVSTILEIISKSKYDIIQFNYNNKFDNGDIIKNPNYVINKKADYSFLKDMITCKNPHFLWNKVYKKEFLDEANFEKIPKVTMGDDLIANIRLACKKPNNLFIEKELYNYYVNTTSVSRKSNNKNLEMIKVMKEIKNVLLENDLYECYKKEYQFQWYRTFFFYVVRNKNGNKDIAKKIYIEYKKEKISMNGIIKEWMRDKKKLEKILANIYNFNFEMGYFISRIYIQVIKGGKNEKYNQK